MAIRDEFGLATTEGDSCVAVDLVGKADIERWRASLVGPHSNWAGSSDFKGQTGQVLELPSESGELERVALGLGDREIQDYWALASLRKTVRAGTFKLTTTPEAEKATLAAYAWALEGYNFSRYKKPDAKPDATLVVPDGVDADEVAIMARAAFKARDLINTPASDLGPAELAAEIEAEAKSRGGECTIISGDALLEQNFPMIHAVGRASTRPPNLVDVTWGAPDHPKITLVGKGVCFDTGGLDLKPSAGMVLMKKDMGGSANSLALAMMIMDAGLPVRLRLLVPCVDNNVSGNAFRPSDILESRKGISVEVGNTDAEGRLVLADALTLADEESPELIIDMATLTGAARSALGPDLPALFTGSNSIAHELARAATAIDDPVWRMPLWDPYEKNLASKVADTNNISPGAFAGAITAALFLRKFVSNAERWVHLDIYGWNPADRPGRPVGGDIMSVRSLFAVLKARYPTS